MQYEFSETISRLDADYTAVETSISDAISGFMLKNPEFVDTHTRLLNRLERDTAFREPVNGKLRHVLDDGSVEISVIGTLRPALYLALRRLYNWTNLAGKPDLASATLETDYAPSLFMSLGETLASDVALVSGFTV
jgi:hypothetical protein